MTHKTNQLERLFINKNRIMKQTIHKQLLQKNTLKVKVESLSKSTIITVVALIGAVIFSINIVDLLLN